VNAANAATGQPAPSVADCPSCGRYIGPAFVCPYCGAEARGRLPLRVLRWAALLLAVAGLTLFYGLAWRSEIPVTAVSSLKPSMQFARIRVRGQVATQPRVFQRDGAPDFVIFDVEDGTGRITVAASHSTAQALVARDLVPGKGLRVEATGSLNAKPGRRLRIYLDAASALKIEGGAAKAPSDKRAADEPEDPDREQS